MPRTVYCPPTDGTVQLPDIGVAWSPSTYAGRSQLSSGTAVSFTWPPLGSVPVRFIVGWSSGTMPSATAGLVTRSTALPAHGKSVCSGPSLGTALRRT